MTQDNPKKYTMICDEVGCGDFYYARGKCRRHYKQLLGREGGYIKDYQRVKDRPEYKIMKSKSDKAYRERMRNMGLLGDMQKEYYLTYISKPENREIRNVRERFRYANRTQTQKWRDAAVQRINKDIIKYEVMSHYSNGTLSCLHCGIDVYPLLTIDHINNDGAKHRKQLRVSGQNMYTWLKAQKYPEGYQVLCQNCNYFKDMIRRIIKPTKGQVI